MNPVPSISISAPKLANPAAQKTPQPAVQTTKPDEVKVVKIAPSRLSLATDFMPLVGAAIAHNFVQNYFMQSSSIHYVRDPLLNTFVNLPVASMVGTAAFLIAKSYLKPEEQKKVATDLEGAQKAIAYAALFNTLYSFSVRPAGLLCALSRVSLFGGPMMSLSLAATSLFAAASLLEYAEEVFADQAEQTVKV